MAQPVSPARRAYDLAGERERKLGSRVTTRQVKAVESVRPDKLPATKAKLREYAQTGDATGLTDSEYLGLRNLVEEAKKQMPNPSQARRLWPRKVAAILAA